MAYPYDRLYLFFLNKIKKVSYGYELRDDTKIHLAAILSFFNNNPKLILYPEDYLNDENSNFSRLMKGESYLVISGYFYERTLRKNRPLSREDYIGLAHYYLQNYSGNVINGIKVPEDFKERELVYQASEILKNLRENLEEERKSLYYFYKTLPESRIIELREELKNNHNN